jgi:hypothetical protein
MIGGFFIGETMLGKQIALLELDQLMVKGICINNTQVSFIEIKENIEALKHKIIKANPNVCIASQDARMVALDSFQQDILSVYLWWMAYNSIIKESKDDQNFIHKIGIKEISELPNIKEWMWKPIRVGFITHINFRLENLLRNILFEICPITKDRIIFIEILSKLQEEGLLINTDKQQLKVLSVIRNALHNNGIHKGSTETISIYGITFDFINGNLINCASWFNILISLNRVIEILTCVLLDQRITNANFIIDKAAFLSSN